MTNKQSTSWCFTLNNYTEQELQMLKILKCKYIIFGHEIGEETETPHLQGFVQFESNYRFASLKKLNKRISWKRRADVSTEEFAANYCCKGREIFEKGEFMNQEQKGQAGKRTYDEAFKAAQEGRFDDIPSSMRIRYYNTYKQIRSDYLASIQPEVVGFCRGSGGRSPSGSLIMRHWQEQIDDLLKQEPDPRKIIIVHDPKGNGGKTTFAEWLEVTYNGQVFEAGDPKELAYILDQTKTLFMFDFARATVQFPWAFIESVKNGRVTSTKYQPVQKRFKKPHIIIFCNSFSNDQLSEDRFHIINI